MTGGEIRGCFVSSQDCSLPLHHDGAVVHLKDRINNRILRHHAVRRLVFAAAEDRWEEFKSDTKWLKRRRSSRTRRRTTSSGRSSNWFQLWSGSEPRQAENPSQQKPGSLKVLLGSDPNVKTAVRTESCRNRWGPGSGPGTSFWTRSRRTRTFSDPFLGSEEEPRAAGQNQPLRYRTGSGVTSVPVSPSDTVPHCVMSA